MEMTRTAYIDGSQKLTSDYFVSLPPAWREYDLISVGTGFILLVQNELLELHKAKTSSKLYRKLDLFLILF
jgi:hypothetical protein